MKGLSVPLMAMPLLSGWPRILRSASAEGSAARISGKFSLFGILQTPSRESTVGTTDPRLLRETVGLSALAEAFPLPWSAYVRLLSVRNELARQFYETEALRGGWSVRQLEPQINSQFYERTALSRKNAAMLEKAGQIAGGDVRR